MSPGPRLLLMPAVALAGALVCALLPGRAQRQATWLALATTLACAGLLISLLGVVSGGAVVSRTFPDLVSGVALGVRVDSTGVVLALSASVAALITLGAGPRRPLQRTGLLFCLAGTATACAGSNLYVLFGGLELGNVGALLMVVDATGNPDELRRARLAFLIQHVGSLGLLASALQLSASVGTASFGVIPPEALTVAVAAPWAMAGLLRLGAAAALPAGSRAQISAAWVGVAAIPSGLVTLLRLDAAAGAGGLPTAVTVALGAGGLVLAGGGAAMALRERARPAAAGRALLTALGGQVAVALAVGSPPAQTAAAGLALALMAAAIAAGAWEAGEASSPRKVLAAAALVGAGGLPVAATTTGLLATTGAEVATGLPHALVAAAAGAGALVAALAAGLAARTVLESPGAPAPAEPAWRRLRPDVAGALVLSALLGLFPGAFLGGLADGVASSDGSISAVGAAAVRGPGFGWAGGYLELGLLVTVVAFVSAAQLQGALWRARPEPVTGVPLEVVGGADEEALAPAPEMVRRAGAALGAVDRWLVTQPDLPALVAVAVAALAGYSLRR